MVHAGDVIFHHRDTKTQKKVEVRFGGHGPFPA